MHRFKRVLSVSVALVAMLAFCTFSVAAEVGTYTHEWAVKIDGGIEEALAVATEQNYLLVDQLFDDVYVFQHQRLAKRSTRPAVHHHRALHKHPKVSWAQQQKVVRRSKRDFQQQVASDARRYQQLESGYPPTTVLNDPQWPQMWYLNRGLGLDMRVQQAWAEGVTGKGVVATILDDGLEKGHPDIIRNYDPDASYDVNNRDKDPAPRYDLIDTNRHGTRCAGEVAADANNSICAVGVAFEASIGGVRMLDGDVTDAVEARSLALNPQHIDIYSASWGPDDDGKTVDGPGELATRAFVEGINNGRNGLGSIFIWASGNGGRAQDNCNCDGYTNAIWTLSISSATERGNVPWYSEACSSTLATTYSSGSTGERKIITTDLHHECTTSHTGTSASAPLAAGVVALALEVNRNMTWRDMQHIVVRTARPDNLDATDWQTNGVGRRVSHRFGYGLMDAYAMVQLARTWITVAPQRSCEVQAPHDDKLIPQKSFVTLKLEVSECPGVEHLEHVQAMVSLSADRRGDLEIYLVSPAGTRSTLLAQRPHDYSRAGFHSWPFMSVHMWGEKPLGFWILEIHNNGHFYTNDKVEMKDFTLVLHGTDIEPGQPATNSANNLPGLNTAAGNSNHLAHQEMLPHRPPSGGQGGKDSNTQRHNPDYPSSENLDSSSISNQLHHHSDGSHSGRAGVSAAGDHHYEGEVTLPGGVGSSATKPIPLSLNSVLAQAPSVKKADVEDTTATHAPPVPVRVTEPSSLPLSPGCLAMDATSCIECVLGQLLYHGACVPSCPDGHFESSSTFNLTTPAASGVPDEPLPRPVYVCLPCHFSCHRCTGQLQDMCTTCWPDYTLQLHSKTTGTCSSSTLSAALSEPGASEHRWESAATTLLILGSVGLIITVFVVLLLRCRRQYKESGGLDGSSGSLISEGVDKLRDFKNGVKNGVKSASKKTHSVGASYRKLSDDTAQLVSSSIPFYDHPSSSEEEIL